MKNEYKAERSKGKISEGMPLKNVNIL
jgi:hypothetical protein